VTCPPLEEAREQFLSAIHESAWDKEEGEGGVNKYIHMPTSSSPSVFSCPGVPIPDKDLAGKIFQEIRFPKLDWDTWDTGTAIVRGSF
jgi:hypothetical protein